MSSMKGLQLVFQPRSVAVIGASKNPRKFGNIILRNILESGYKGTVYPVNPKEEEILGKRCSKSIRDINEEVDLAVVVVPAEYVPRAVADCGEKGVAGTVIISGGFRESGPKGVELERQIVIESKRFGLRIIGPNCQGISNLHHPICASWPLFTKRGSIAVISQSGTVATAFADWASLDDLGISALVSMGNKADVDEADLIDYFSTHEGTKVIALYLEGTQSPTKLLRSCSNCSKPIVVLKSGRSNQGKIAAESHTSSLAGNDELFQGILKQHRIRRADTFEDFYDLSKAIAYLSRPKGNKFVIITSSGGAAVLAIDMADKMNLEIPSVPLEVQASLRQILPRGASVRNPVDLTGDGDSAMFKRAADIVRPYFDTVVYIFGDPIDGASDIVSPRENELVIFMGGAEVERKEKALMQQKGVPVFPTPERGMKAFGRLLEF